MPEPRKLMLSPEDRRVLDALVDRQFDPARLDEADRPRGQKIVALLGVLDALPVDDRAGDGVGDLLVERTLQTIRQTRQREQAEQNHHGLNGGMGPSIRLNDLVAVAAVLVIGLTLAMPLLSHQRSEARRIAGQANLAAASMGFESYAQANDGRLPAVKAHPGDVWWDINSFNEDGSARSNSAHLFLLIRSGHVQPSDLNCPENPHALDDETFARLRLKFDLKDWPNAGSISFSYQNQFAERPVKWTARPGIAILADKNPLFTAGGQRDGVEPTSPSPNHLSLGGQNVLFNDGSVRWVASPILGPSGDNIWQSEDHDESTYTGTETPADEDDAFLVW